MTIGDQVNKKKVYCHVKLVEKINKIKMKNKICALKAKFWYKDDRFGGESNSLLNVGVLRQRAQRRLRTVHGRGY